MCGLPAGQAFTLGVHARGDLREGATSTGAPLEGAAGSFLRGVAGADGCARLTADVAGLRVWEVIGRAAVLRPEGGGAVAAVMARSAAVGGNTKRTCACDGTVLWEIPAARV